MALLATCFSAKAQISANDWMIGGSARFFASNIAGQFTANAEISADGAYLFQLDKNEEAINKGTIALGIMPSFAWDPTNDRYRGSIFSRYYYNFERVSPFIGADIGYGLNYTYSSSTGDLFSYSESLILGGKLGGAFYLSPNVTFDAFFFYERYNITSHKQDVIEGFPSSSKRVEYTLGLGLGFQIFLQCKK